MATSAWLISRAAQHPSVQAVAVAVVAIRFFALSRAALRYAERLVGHDTALRVLADLRVRVYVRLERLAPTGLPAFRSGDLLARLVDDVDAVQDLLVRVLPPYLVAVLAGGTVVLLTGWLLPAAGALLLVTLLLAALAVPALSLSLARRSQARSAQARGELGDAVVDLLRGAPDLVAYGVAGPRLAGVAAVDAELTTAARASAATTGIGAGLTLLLSGAALWGSVVLAVPAVRSGRLDRGPARGPGPRPAGGLRGRRRTTRGCAGPGPGAALLGPRLRGARRRRAGTRAGAATAPARRPGGAGGRRAARALPGVPPRRAGRGGPRPGARPARRGGRTERGRQVDPGGRCCSGSSRTTGR